MAAGPIVGGSGLLLFTRVDARGAYLADVLPATLLFGLGLAMTVAPLTATVLAAAERRHAGIASGVNNAIARVAGLLAIAAVGLVVSAQFASQVDARIAAAGGGRPDAATRAYVDAARARPLAVPDGSVAAGPRAAVRAASVAAFHRGMVVSGLLMLAGGLIAGAAIANPPRVEAPPRPPAVAA
jgi:hypothetical protein